MCARARLTIDLETFVRRVHLLLPLLCFETRSFLPVAGSAHALQGWNDIKVFGLNHSMSAGGLATGSNILAAGASSDLRQEARSASGDVAMCAQTKEAWTADPAESLEASSHLKLTRWARV